MSLVKTLLRAIVVFIALLTPISLTSAGASAQVKTVNEQVLPGDPVSTIANNYITSEAHPDQCVDTDSHYVYMGTCKLGDHGQYWIIWNGGWVKNVATGDCLGQISGMVQMVPCIDEVGYYWRYWQGGWFQRILGPACLVNTGAIGVQLQIKTCANVRSQYWRVGVWAA